MASKQMNPDQWVEMVEGWFAKFPPLPTNVKNLMVKFAPILALVFGVLGILGAIAATGFLAVLSPVVVLGGGFGVAAGGIVGSILMLVSSVMMVMAYTGLRDHKMVGWKYSFWSQTVSVAGSVLALNLVGALISVVVGYYLLFQIKSYYK